MISFVDFLFFFIDLQLSFLLLSIVCRLYKGNGLICKLFNHKIVKYAIFFSASLVNSSVYWYLSPTPHLLEISLQLWRTVLFTIWPFEAMPVFFCVILCKLQIDIFFFATETCWKICFMLLCNILPDSRMYQRENCFTFPCVHFFLDEFSNNLRFCIQYRVIKIEQRCYQSI